MNHQLRRRIEANLFPPSRPAAEPWDDFRWHLDRAGQPDTDKEHSSQALAISVFGTIKVAEQEERDAITGAIAHTVGVPMDGPWTVELEWSDKGNAMKEPRQTQVDAYASSPHAQILIESKFTEPDGGPCSQTKALSKGAHKGLAQCNGNYESQTNPVNQQRAMCALTGKGIRYWEVVPEVFRFSADERLPPPCPFAGPWFQWMRNLTVAYETGRTSGRKSAFVVAYADAPGLPMADQIRSPQWQRFIDVLIPDALPLKTISLQQIAAIAINGVTAAGLPSTKWRNLAEWVDRRISGVAHALGRS